MRPPGIDPIALAILAGLGGFVLALVSAWIKAEEKRAREAARRSGDPPAPTRWTPPPAASVPRATPNVASKPAPPADPIAVWRALPNRILFVDVETTGLGAADAIVSLGVVRLITDPLDVFTLHLVFNPERKCGRGATAVHGWTDAMLKPQDPIGPYLPSLRRYLERADLVVAHNAAFDMRFLDAAMTGAGLHPIMTRRECTMLDYRARGEGSAAMDAIARRLGIARAGKHGALEDAWMAMQVWLWMKGLPWNIPFSVVPEPGIANLREPPPPPPKRPRGRPRKAAKVGEGADATASAEQTETAPH